MRAKRRKTYGLSVSFPGPDGFDCTVYGDSLEALMFELGGAGYDGPLREVHDPNGGRLGWVSAWEWRHET